ncbi:SNARE domain protein [Dictyocaulus viviparus]|uniref:SNARE domain protein n=1 Tax=Dictyocaulus viviparus TaxID=29172 RepID=A0A0D8XL90_DICVI|nr:SNARE domain protein [Dictyocaulus viviparus]
MKKDQVDSLSQALHTVVLRFREQEVPFEEVTRLEAEAHLREFQMVPDSELPDVSLNCTENGGADVYERSLKRGTEVGECEKGLNTECMTEAVLGPLSLKTTEINEENNEYDEKAVLLEVKERNKEILLLEEAVSTLNSLHEHLNFLVHTQNDKVDRIDANISQALEYTEKVKKETDEAVQLQSQANQKSVLVFIFIAALVLMFLVMLTALIKV